ncbi:unnamed protein product [Oikopleura dioica]|uniref:Metalloendopeptidase n=1 Tax=Oikopleura dioica TaxID=34765 RepID=E4X4F0_OIKDI|nr:unnamed protein product [Oikopleura dioica]
MPGVGPIGELLAPILPPANYMDNDRIWTKAQALQAGVDMTKAKIHPEPLGSSSSSSNRGAGNVPRWPGNTDGIDNRPYLLIPYRFTNGAHTSFAGSQEYIADSFDMITADTGGCIRFVDDSVDQAHSHWVDIQDSPTGGCVSYVGYLGAFTSQFPNGQMLNLNPGSGPGTGGSCLASYVVNHEMLHALGFNHEQERFDRDDHVTIHMDRVQPDKQHNFEKLSAQEWFDMSSPYDGQSVMHYSAYSFQTADASAANLPTITNLAGEPVQWPRVQRLSSTDVLQLAKMYDGFCGQPGGEFIKVRTCTDGAQYLENRACDGINDCADGSDEEAAFCASLCEPDTFHVSENGCNDSQDWTGAYPKMAEGAYPKSLTISLDGGDASNGFEAGTFIRMDQADWCFDTPDMPSYKRVGLERYIWPMPGGAWYMGSTNCASSLNYYYFPSQNGNVANFWDLEVPLFNRWNGEWVTSDNQRFKKGAEGWQNGDFILSQGADGSWSISDSSSSISLGNNACVTFVLRWNNNDDDDTCTNNVLYNN